jgi:hypothetical protein
LGAGGEVAVEPVTGAHTVLGRDRGAMLAAPHDTVETDLAHDPVDSA